MAAEGNPEEREGKEWEGTAGAGELPIQNAGPVHATVSCDGKFLK